MARISRQEIVVAFHANTKGTSLANQIVSNVFSLFIRTYLAHSYAINKVVDMIAKDDKVYRHNVKLTCRHIESEYDRMVSLMRTAYNIKEYSAQVEDMSRYYFEAMSKEIDMIRVQVWQVFTRHQEKNKLLLSYIYTAAFIADWAQKSWETDTAEVDRLLYVNRQFLPADINTRKLFNPLKVDTLVFDIRKLADAFIDKSRKVTDLNDDPNVRLAVKVFLNKLNDESIVNKALEKAGFLQENKNNEI